MDTVHSIVHSNVTGELSHCLALHLLSQSPSHSKLHMVALMTVCFSKLSTGHAFGTASLSHVIGNHKRIWTRVLQAYLSPSG